jgi:hypothetical protein
MPAQTRADSFTIENWSIGVSVYRAWPDLAADGSSTVVNPFIASYQVSLPSNPATFAAAQYDISWLANYGDFNISAQLAAQDGNWVRSRASGTIYLQTDVDLTFILDAALNYALPTYGLYAYLGFSVQDLTTSQNLFGTTQTYDSVTGPPAVGALGIVQDITLPAGHQFRVQYQSTLNTFGASTGLASANGHVNFTISPEPASLVLLAAPLLLARSRRIARRPTP